MSDVCPNCGREGRIGVNGICQSCGYDFLAHRTVELLEAILETMKEIQKILAAQLMCEGGPEK